MNQAGLVAIPTVKDLGEFMHLFEFFQYLFDPHESRLNGEAPLGGLVSGRDDASVLNHEYDSVLWSAGAMGYTSRDDETLARF